MFKTINNSIVFVFALLAVLAFGLVAIQQASAASGYYGGTSVDNSYYSNQASYPVYTKNNSAPATNSTSASSRNSTGNNQSSNSGTATANNSSATSKTADGTAENGNDLASSAILAGAGSLFSGLTMWIIVAILMLLAVIFIRRIFGADHRYHAEPMKHD
ncbi:hypothetical protein A2917_01885 [Candidatus Nomurabacteria bacterium RIFCSPLOWO2_01_FULL_42_17]|uniref:Uncharacterized protein n=1 Tax=Candidatus Nomurabacteria bacterium RIFCSPLOWO2_01_FULL_42_17 TaxID=1801780 RepID=A0A1F6XLA8_9BACT|nr:MAG: hypothetical protein A2917_01885 [Candidatus Nomurabacteria bacterium RIFCSPLOWO2_01_FULL_42_17]